MIILGLVFIIFGIATFITGSKRSKDTWSIMEDFFEDEIFDDGSDMMTFGIVISLIGLVLTIRWMVVNRYKIRGFFKNTLYLIKKKFNQPKKKKEKHRHSELYYTFYYYKYKIKKFFKNKKEKKENEEFEKDRKKREKHRHGELYYTFYYYKHKIKKTFRRTNRKNADKKETKNDKQ